MARIVIATDNFNRANGALGSNWESLNPTSGGAVEIDTNVIGGANTGGHAVARFVGTTAPDTGQTINESGVFTDDQYSRLTFVETDFGVSPYGMGVIVRASGDTDGARDYFYFFANSNDTYVVGRLVDGVDTANLATGSHTWADGDILELEVEGQSPNITLRAMKNGGAVTIATVSNVTGPNSGKPGVLGSGDSFVATGDDWEGGNLGEEAGTPQLLAPAQDITVGPWVPSAGSPAELWQMLDGEESPDNDYCSTISAGTMEVKFSSGITPTVQTGHTVRYRLRGNGSTDALVKLKQGSTVIAQWTETNVPDTDTDYEHTLDSSPSFSITDYSDLRLSVEAIP